MMRQMWFRVGSAKPGEGSTAEKRLSWRTPELARLTLSEPAIARIEEAITSSAAENNPIAHSMGATVETEIEMPDGCLELLEIEANGAPEVQYRRCAERIVRPVVLASAKGVALRVYGADHDVLLKTERVALNEFRVRVREARSRELGEAMAEAMNADARAAMPKRSEPGML